jgi:tetratricopeptide (TPR) repeat protein
MRELLYALVLILGYLSPGFAQATDKYETLVQTGKGQLQAGDAGQALASGEKAIKLSPGRWEAYALAGGALMNLKRYEDAADRFSKAIDLAPEGKQSGLRELRKQCALAEAGVGTPTTPISPTTSAPVASTTQAEVVVWKSIENSASITDFQAYLNQYPNGAFASMAQAHIDQIQSQEKQREDSIRAQQAAQQSAREQVWEAGVTFKVDHNHGGLKQWMGADGTLNISPRGVAYSEAGKFPDHKFSAPCSDITWSTTIGPGVRIDVRSTKVGWRLSPYGDKQQLDLIFQTLTRYCGSRP